MRRSVAAVLITSAILGVAPRASAEEPPLPSPGLFAPERLAPIVRQAVEAGRAVQQAPQSAVHAQRRDSILNGGLIGAAVGGVGGSALIVASRGGSDDIPRAMMNVALLPAVFGFAAGALIDALR